MLREPRLARWLGGLERMYRWHHRTGVVAYMLLLAHPLTLATRWLAAAFSRRLSYGVWRSLHAGLAVGVLFGLVHLVLLGIDEPVLPIIAVVALILAWRALRGDLGWLRGRTGGGTSPPPAGAWSFDAVISPDQLH